MTVTSNSYAPLLYNGNGSATAFAVTFPYYEIKVYHIDSAGAETLWTENTHYTTGINDGEGGTGTVTVSTSPTDYTPASGEQLRIERVTARTQEVDHDIDNQVVEDGIQEADDRALMIIQEMIYNTSRSPILSMQDAATHAGNITLPTPTADKLIGWNAAGDDLENKNDWQVFSQSAEPSGGTYQTGDLWIDTDDGQLYRYNGSSWADTGANLIGPQGPAGAGDLISTNNLSDLDNAATARTNMGVAIGTDVQAHSAVLDATTASFTTADETKLDAIETSATADQTGAEIKSLYEAEADTNAFTDADHSKLDGIEAGADVTDEANVTDALDGATLTDAGTPASDDKVLIQDTSDSNVLKYVEASELGGSGGASELLHIQDQKSSGTDGGAFTSGADRIRDINTVVTNEITGASLSSNQITLPAGTYDIIAFAPALAVNRHQALLYNVTDSAEIIRGKSRRARSDVYGSNDSMIKGRFTLAATKVLEIRHRCETTKSINGFGMAASFSTEIYTDVEIRKVA